MSGEAYEILALFMRYVFVVIGGVIVWRAFRWLLKDHRAYRREMKALPDAGLVGEMVNLGTGKASPLPREGTIGSSRECDIRVRGSGVMRKHARFEFVNGAGLRVIPFRGASVTLGDRTLRGAGFALHGTQLRLGDDVTLRVRLFAGLNVPRAAAPQPSRDEKGIEDFTPQNLATPAPGFSGMEEIDDPEQYQILPDHGPALFPDVSQASGYDGHFTPDGEMTWQYAYSLEELHQAMATQQQPPFPRVAPEEDEGIPYQSPLDNRRRRRNRHG